MKISLLLMLYVFSIASVSAQIAKENIYVTPSSNASSAVKSVNVQVGHYTGIAYTSIPLHTLAGKDISVPVSVDYSASGIKVQDISGPVGLGWNLNAGGLITRVVRGLPDGVANPFCVTDVAKVNSNYWGTCDGERDVFYFSFLGRSGKMFLGDDGAMYTMPYLDIKITPAIGTNGVGYWIITDENGYSYYFGENSASKEDTKYYTGNSSGTLTERSTYTSSWFLTKVVSNKSQNVATFSYTSSVDESYALFGEKRINEGTITISDVKITTLSPKYINTIVTSLGSISFQFVDSKINPNEFSDPNLLVNYPEFLDNKDEPSKRKLDKIVIKDYTGVVIKDYTFHISTYLCRSDFPGFAWSQRMKLASIAENGTLKYTFLYDETAGGAGLPYRRSDWVDRFGFYNKNSNSLIRYSIIGGTRESNFNTVTAFSLKEIKYLGGAKTVFEYSPTFSGRALTIKSISQYSNTTLVSKSTYTYSDQQTVGPNPVFEYTLSGTTYKSSHSFRDVYDIDGIGCGHSAVTETFLDGSKIVMQFSNFSDQPDEAPYVAKYKATSPSNLINEGTLPNTTIPFSPSTSNAPMRGLLRDQKIYDNTNKLVQWNSYKYVKGSIVKSVEGWAVELYKGGSPPTYAAGKYFMKSFPVQLIETNTYVYDQQNTNEFNRTYSTYSYHPTHKTFPSTIITSKISTNNVADNDQLRTNFKYPTDVVGSASSSNPQMRSIQADGMWTLRAKNMIFPVEQLQLCKQGTGGYNIVAGALSTFRKNPVTGMPQPYESYVLNLGAPLINLSIVTALASNGQTLSIDPAYRKVLQNSFTDLSSNIASETSSDGITTYYEWGYNNTLPTVSYAMFSGNQYRNTTAYNTVFGVTSQTDPNNQSTSYSYDLLGRLKLVRDTDNNIVQRYRYNTNGSVDNALNFAHTVNPDNSIGFTIVGSAEVGTNIFFDFGNGTVRQNVVGSQVMMYNTPATYNIKLATSHPEFPTATTTKNITILPVATIRVTNANIARTLTVCTTSGSVNIPFDVTIAQAGTYNYQWQYVNGSSSVWTTVGSNSNLLNFSYGSAQGSISTIRCIITDPNGNKRYSNSISITRYCATGGGGGGTDCPLGCSYNEQTEQCECLESCGEGCFRLAKGVCNCY